MTTAYWCVLALVFFPPVLGAMAKSAGFDNSKPREALAAATGWRKRADWAQQNHHEIFPAFAAAVIIAHLGDASQAAINGWALAFVALRIAYSAIYVADLATLRTLVWSAGVACVVALCKRTLTWGRFRDAVLETLLTTGTLLIIAMGVWTRMREQEPDIERGELIYSIHCRADSTLRVERHGHYRPHEPALLMVAPPMQGWQAPLYGMD